MLAAILLGTGVLVVSVLFYAVAIIFIVHFMVHLTRDGYSGQSVWKNIAIMMLLTIVTAAAHLTEIALWAMAFLYFGQIHELEKAFYFSAQNYTALGYGDILLPERWRLLGPLEAVNGLLLFGISTAAMFAVLSRLVANHFPSRHSADATTIEND